MLVGVVLLYVVLFMVGVMVERFIFGVVMYMFILGVLYEVLKVCMCVLFDRIDLLYGLLISVRFVVELLVVMMVSVV